MTLRFLNMFWINCALLLVFATKIISSTRHVQIKNILKNGPSRSMRSGSRRIMLEFKEKYITFCRFPAEYHTFN